MNPMATGFLYAGYFGVILDWLVKLVAIYTMYMATKALKVYIKKNS